MKKILVFFPLLALLAAASAQTDSAQQTVTTQQTITTNQTQTTTVPVGRTFKPFKVDIGLGYGIPAGGSGNNLKSGIIAVIEPQISPIDPVAIGLRLEGDGTGSVNTENSSNSTSSFNLSGLLTINYYFTNSNFRPFIGGGLGGFQVVNYADSLSASREVHFGGMLRAGFEFDHFWLDVEYNFISPSNPGNIQNSYVGIKLGGYFGGGRYNQ